jgi:NAD-dependent dihydropyrimidine dehydrogenase PreA subunit
MPGAFIDVELTDAAREDSELARRLEEACPVDIFAAREGRTELVEDNLDECVLCELCTAAAPPGAVRVIKRYDGTALERLPCVARRIPSAPPEGTL